MVYGMALCGVTWSMVRYGMVCGMVWHMVYNGTWNGMTYGIAWMACGMKWYMKRNDVWYCMNVIWHGHVYSPVHTRRTC